MHDTYKLISKESFLLEKTWLKTNELNIIIMLIIKFSHYLYKENKLVKGKKF